MDEQFYEDLKEVRMKYSCAVQKIETYIKILEEDFTFRYNYNPIDHIVTRIKTPESIVQKLEKHNYEKTIENVTEHVFDIAGIRIVCPFENDVARVINIIKENKDVEIIKEKDYITNPKKSGYRSYHLIVMAHVHMINGNEDIPVEIQIRTLAQDFWASLEHQITYKYSGEVPVSITQELRECSDVADLLDKKMLDLSNELHNSENKGDS